MNTRQHYRDALKFILRLRDAEDRDIGFPTFDFRARFHCAGSARSFTASYIGGRCVNCHNHDGRLEIICADHGLPPGQLLVDFHADIPDSCFPDGRRPSVRPLPLDIELTIGPSDLPTAAEVEATVPFIVRGLLESEAPLLGGILDRVNSTFDSILGPGGATPGAPGASAAASSPIAPRYLQRGIIAIHSRPGVVYRNVGLIRVPLAKNGTTSIDLSTVGAATLPTDPYDTAGSGQFDIDTGAYPAVQISGYYRRPCPPTYLRIRLSDTPEPDGRHAYIMKCPDGIIRTFDRSAIKVIDTTLEAPVIRRLFIPEAISLDQYIDRELRRSGCRIQIQYKRRSRTTKRTYWGRLCRTEELPDGRYQVSPSGTYGNKKRGVFRVRYIDNKKRRSPWSAFSYYRNSDIPCTSVFPI